MVMNLNVCIASLPVCVQPEVQGSTDQQNMYSKINLNPVKVFVSVPVEVVDIGQLAVQNELRSAAAMIVKI